MRMPVAPLVFWFGDSTLAEGNRYAGSLADMLWGFDPAIQVGPLRERVETQDFGARLAVILGTAAVSALAKGITSWLARNSGAKIEIRRDGQLMMTASHLNSADVSKLAEVLCATGLSNGGH